MKEAITQVACAHKGVRWVAGSRLGGCACRSKKRPIYLAKGEETEMTLFWPKGSGSMRAIGSAMWPRFSLLFFPLKSPFKAEIK